MKKICVSLFVFVVLQCVLSLPSAAQVPLSCLVFRTLYYPDPIPIGWFYYSSAPGTYAFVVAAPKCPPPAPPPCHCPRAGSPISLGTGETFITQADINIPGLGGGLSLTRTWNSIWPHAVSSFSSGIFGNNWRSTYEERIVMGTDNYLRYIRSDGTFLVFGPGDGSSFNVLAPANVAATLNTDTTTNPYFTLTFPNGEQRRFDKTNGILIAIIDRNGNTTTVTYDSSGRLSTVTDAASRTLTFTYGNSTFISLVTSVSSSVGISYSYAYDTQGRLTQVTKPDQTTVSFTYNSQSLITAVTDSNGKVLESHTYDTSARGLTSSRANGVEALTISYPQ
jgi:YD repeat-containing protein